MTLIVPGRTSKASKLSVPESSGRTQGILVTSLAKDQLPDWDDLVTKSPHGTVFHYSWWLNATGVDFEILGCWDEDGKLVAGMPLPRKKRTGLRLYHAPSLAPYLGPIFDLSGAESISEQLSRMRHWGETLGHAVQGFDCLHYLAGAAGPDLQGFVWAGFRAEIAYTFRIDAGTTSEEVFHQISRTHRQKLRKNAQYAVETADDVASLSKLSNQTFLRQGMSRPFDDHYLRRLWDAASKRGRAILYMARELDGTPVASLLVVNDDRTSYQIVSGMDMKLRDSPAGYLLTWRAICDALEAGRAFDFEGSGVRGVEQYYRRWGVPARPVWHLKKEGSLRGLIATTVFSEMKVSRRKTTQPSRIRIPKASKEPPSSTLQAAQPPQLFVRMARSIVAWGAPNNSEENLSWRYLRECERVLDVACGTGKFIARRPRGVTGVDIDEENVAACRACGFDAVQGNALNLPFTDGSFDGVHSAQVMFVFQPKHAVRYLDELVRVTKPGGIIAISNLCDLEEVFAFPEVARPYPPQSVFRMISTPQQRGGTDVRGVVFKGLRFRHSPLIKFDFSMSPRMWRVGSVLNALQYGFLLRRYWSYRGYTIIFEKTRSSAPAPAPASALQLSRTASETAAQ